MTFIKLMWMPEGESVMWNMQDEEPIPERSLVHTEISKYLDIKNWRTLYALKYNSWLQSLSGEIFQINDPVNIMALEAVDKYNKMESIKDRVFYWFDIDREKNEDYQWELCPITGEKLASLGTDYPMNNRLVSWKKNMVFPFHPSI